MAKLSYNLWSIRKKMSPARIVSLGVRGEESLEAFLSERNVQMPEDLTEFRDAWEAALANEKAEAAIQKPLEAQKEPVKKSAKPEEKKTTKATPKRTTRRSKTNIKDSSKET